MTNAPYLSKKHRAGARLGHDRLIDHMFFDGLEDAYEPGKLMGNFAEETAAEYQFTRKAQDDFAIASLERAQKAQKSGAFDREIVPVEVKTRKGSETVRLDEQPAKGDVAKIPTLKPAFSKDGTVTAANASSISGRRGRSRDDARVGRREARHRSDRTRRCACGARARACAVHHRPRLRDAQGA